MSGASNTYKSSVNIATPAVLNYDGPDESAAYQFQIIANALATLNQSLGNAISSVKKCAQIVSAATGALMTGATVIPYDNTIPQITEGNEYLTATITPQNAASILEIDVVIEFCSSVSNNLIAALFQDATANALKATSTWMQTATGAVVLTFKHIMVAGTVAATTFRLRAGGASAGTTTVNGWNAGGSFGGTQVTSITIKEWLP